MIRSLRTSWFELAVAASSGVPMGLLTVAAAVPATRPVALGLLIVGVAVAMARGAPARWAWAGGIPVALALTWALVPPPLADPLGADCTRLDSPPAVWRGAEAVIALGGVAILAFLLRARPSDLGLRWPGRPTIAVAALGAAVLGPMGLLLGAELARPFFGVVTLDLSRPGFLLPALLFAVANGVMEELTYRGVLLHWTSRAVGVRAALAGQAIVFGIAHGGADVNGWPIVLMTALAVGGYLAGVIALRTRSLYVPIAWHVALDLPLYLYLACRNP